MHGLAPLFELLNWIKSIEKRVTRGAAKAGWIIPHRKTLFDQAVFHSEHHISGIQYHNQLENTSF